MRADRLAYSFGLLSCHHGDEIARNMTNPFTGEKVAVHQDPGLDGDERRAVSELLRKHGAQSEATDEYQIDFSDDDSITVQIGPLDGSFPVKGAEMDIVCKQLRNVLLEFALRFANAAGMALVTTVMKDSGEFTQSTRVLSEPIRKSVQARWPDAEVIKTTEQLRDWLDNVVGSRAVY
jgi:hypothetical protein